MNRVLVSIVFLSLCAWCVVVECQSSADSHQARVASCTTTYCDDGNNCTTDSCDPVYGCQHVPISCNDNNACTQDICDPVKGCLFAATVCDDANACTVDICDVKLGCEHYMIICNDNKACSRDTCDPVLGCQYAPIPSCTEDPCANSCATNGVCSNSTGTYKCVCPSGFTGNGYTCIDIDECANASTCAAGVKCVNTVGSYNCTGLRKYFITNAGSGLVMTGGGDGDAVVMMPNKTASFDNQLWNYVPAAGGGYVQNVQTGYVLDIDGGDPYAGALIITWDKKLTGWTSNQQWTYALPYFNAFNGLVLDVQGALMVPNTPVILWTKKYPTATNQQFYLIEYVF